jgi:hypothetical protein
MLLKTASEILLFLLVDKFPGVAQKSFKIRQASICALKKRFVKILDPVDQREEKS